MTLASGDGTLPLLAALGESAKQHRKRKFQHLYETMCRMDVLRQAWSQAAANDGAPGIDGIGFETIEKGPGGVNGFLEDLQEDLEAGRYQPRPVRRVYIPKPGKPGQQRPLGVPTVRDRVAMTAAKLVLEPILEGRFLDCSYGFRPGRSALDALDVVRTTIEAGNPYVVDVDIAGFFDNVTHEKMLWLLDEHVWDPRMRKLVRKWLTAGLVYHGRREATEKGTVQGGPLSPLLANLYLHYFDRLWRREGGALGQLVRYADDMVILSASAEQAAGAMETVRRNLKRLDLWVNEEKTRVVNLRDKTQGFDFLGYTHHLNSVGQRGRTHLSRRPGAKAVQRMVTKVKDLLLSPYLSPNLPDIIAALNAVLRGWGAYFRWGESLPVFSKVDNYVRRRFALYLARKYGRKGTGWKWRRPDGTWMTIYRLLKALGIHRLSGTQRTYRPVATA
jgi:RNA-directed DNA polymerase